VSGSGIRHHIQSFPGRFAIWVQDDTTSSKSFWEILELDQTIVRIEKPIPIVYMACRSKLWGIIRASRDVVPRGWVRPHHLEPGSVIVETHSTFSAKRSLLKARCGLNFYVRVAFKNGEGVLGKTHHRSRLRIVFHATGAMTYCSVQDFRCVELDLKLATGARGSELAFPCHPSRRKLKYF
jgi:hypothetical protein